MRAVVSMLNLSRGMLAVETNNGYTIIEILDSSIPELGDILSGDLDSLGSETLINISKNEVIDTYIQDIYATKEAAIKTIS